MRPVFSLPLIGMVALLAAAPLYAQRAPAIPGVTGTLVTPETARDEKKAEDKAGAAVKDAVTPDDRGPLSDLTPGATVVIRRGTDVTEGIVAKIDRSANEITVRYENKKIEKLVLTDRETPDARTVEYTDDGHQKITRYFKLKS